MGSFIDLSTLQTEGLNPRTTNIDQVSTVELCHLINDEDVTVPGAIGSHIPTIAAAIDALAPRVSQGGRVVYVGAGTSGRLGVVDASEIPPTFSAPFGQFVALIAGGDAAMRKAQEGAEDDYHGGKRDLESLNLDPELDSLIGIAASGRTPYVLSCLEYAKTLGCITVGVACSHPSTMSASGLVDYMINPVTGPEVITGSTRMKAGTATKLVLNMLSTGIMIKIGKTYGNMMVDVKTSNLKLQQRSRNIIRNLSGSACPSTDEDIDELLQRCDGSVKLSLAVLALNSTPEHARTKLEASGGKLSALLIAGTTSKYGPKVVEVSRSTFEPVKFILYIDGGGTKCRAIVVSSLSHRGEGEAGPCNVSDLSLDSAILAIILAAERALDNLSSRLQPKNRALNLQNVEFTAIWIGVAGYDRPQMKWALDPKLSSEFRLAKNGTLKLSNDIEVLALAPSANDGLSTNCPSTNIVLVSGTGSVAVRYCYDGSTGKVAPNGRSGGWGHLLGDDGSGFDVGRSAIRSTLFSLDILRHSSSSNGTDGMLSPLSQRVLDHFGISQDTNNYDLLSAILTDTGTESSNRCPKNKVASVARLVLDAFKPPKHQPSADPSRVDGEAHEIIIQGIRGLIRTLKPLLPQTADSGNCNLILGGGLLSGENDVYRSELMSELEKDGIIPQIISSTTVVNDPCSVGAKILEATYLK
ncbi:N-acetylmuramic acid 6-phosphate etherase [Nannizzia gypsea CBS 118893]|uniref:N-acetylmuramic acid 6-phosphate etherase n=1 Tax=Arthroderma gypseum (strain ATCC MYA-4604 / CBS 118893) TaxID=535722 RepID=E4UWH6_ARTGP|nr:N-acetylmuramic acid 6-phosphate etherase [Nannizzia gypsea CBS 118893]EFR01732.1 N-acetylmuramic acid 6-phosphate etherase [Nannizzia gypsea CBS 118893]